MTRRLADVVTAPRSTVSGYVICIRSMCGGCFVYDVEPAGFNYNLCRMGRVTLRFSDDVVYRGY